MTSNIKYKKYNENINFAGNLEARNLVSGAWFIKIPGM
jgi:hypothetical protein